MMYKNLSELTTSGQTGNIKVKVIRMWDSINPSTDELISIDMILMDEQVFYFTYLTMNSSIVYTGNQILFIFCFEG